MAARRQVLLKDLERSLNADSKLLLSFLKDPAKIMGQLGIVLSQDHAASIKSQMATMQLGRLVKILSKPRP